MTSKNVILAGGSGFIGRALSRALLARGNVPIVLTRGESHVRDGVRHVQWDGTNSGAWCAVLDGAAAIVNLAGRNVNCRLTDANRAEILGSRVDSIHALQQALTQCAQPPGVWVNAGGKDIYGDRGAEVLTERSVPGPGVLTDVCLRWEAAFDAAVAPGVRKVMMRIGIVLGEEGALPVLARLTRAFAGGAAGDGQQYLSWIHRDDMVAMLLWAIDSAQVSGVYNAVAPEPVSNSQFMAVLRRVLGRPWSPPVPRFAVALGAALAGSEAALILEGNRVLPERAQAGGFRFEYPGLEAALQHLLV
jgi:hypothetical protein